MSNPVTKNDYTKASGAARCVDERADKQGELLGVQMPGGSEHIMDLLLVAITLAGESVSEAKLFEMANRVYASTIAKTHQMMPGVHIDDHHSELDIEDCSDRDAGCGYDKVRVEVLNRVGVATEYSSGERITTAREHNWNVQVLTGDHVPTATAAINSVVGTTLKTQDLLASDRVQSFNYDHWVVSELTPVFVEILTQEGFEKAAQMLEENAKEWGEEIYAETLDILSNGALGKDSLIRIE